MLSYIGVTCMLFAMCSWLRASNAWNLLRGGGGGGMEGLKWNPTITLHSTHSFHCIPYMLYLISPYNTKWPSIQKHSNAMPQCAN